MVIDVPDYVGIVTERMSTRCGRMVKTPPGRAGAPGFSPVARAHRLPGEFLTATRGTGLLNTMFDGWSPWGGR